MSYTKGKWVIEQKKAFSFSEISCDSKTICNVYSFAVGEEANANANLICSAPALLEALEAYMQANKNLGIYGYADKEILRAARDDFFHAEKAALAAIALARGNS